MRNFIIGLLILTGLNLSAQAEKIAGAYYLKWECDSHQIEYKLSLSAEGDYELNTYTTDLSGQDDAVHKTENGSWTAVEKMLTFSSRSKKDFDEEYTVDLNGSIARFIMESPSDNSEKEHRTVLIFDTSKIYCIEGMEFVKMKVDGKEN